MKSPLHAVLATLVLVSCAPEAVELPCPPWIQPGLFPYTPQPTREVDILLVVDNSGDMDEEQRRLVAQLPRLVRAMLEVERDDEDVDLDSVRLGVVSTDMGSGDQRLPTCDAPDGDDGLLQNGQVGTRENCVAGGSDWTELGPDPEEFGHVAQCLANLGGRGCGIEQPLESMLKALTGSSAGPIFAGGSSGNAGHNNLLRDDALLVVLVLTGEDDCSIADPELFTRNSATYTDPDLDTRCWRYEDQAALHSTIRRWAPRDGGPSAPRIWRSRRHSRGPRDGFPELRSAHWRRARPADERRARPHDPISALPLV
ncbi:MAG: hypothetical protein AB8H86_31335 [Polyangiales bacterium]